VTTTPSISSFKLIGKVGCIYNSVRQLAERWTHFARHSVCNGQKKRHWGKIFKSKILFKSR